MSENAQEATTEVTGIEPVPGHQGGVPPAATDAPEAEATRRGEPDKIEPRAGRDE